MGSLKWGHKSPKLGYNCSYPTYIPTGLLGKEEYAWDSGSRKSRSLGTEVAMPSIAVAFESGPVGVWVWPEV